MTTVAIDSNLLNELFDNQKNLDAIFNDDFFLDGPMIAGDSASESSTLEDDLNFNSSIDISPNPVNKSFLRDNRLIFSLLVPVILEVAAIVYGISYFL
jgi:hypothetical protein